MSADKRERHFNNSVWEKNWGYCRAVKVGNVIHVSGTVGQGADAAEQTRAALKTIEDALKKLGASFKDVVRTRMYLTHIERDFDVVGKIHGETFGQNPPATAMIGVSRFVDPKFVVEIEAEAIISSSKL